ncbi:aldo/keto reductase [candidate division KSB1 bacterium]|nr:aldo/keto reductase [candidate division KSB1 bacterium]
MLASPEKTAAHQARHHLPESARCEFGAMGLRVSRLGFGCYRVDEITAEHATALKLALRSGINLIDTSTNYTDGSSERMVGRILQELFKSSELQREEVVVVSKAGYVQGQNLQLAQERERQDRGFPEMVKYVQNCWHCIHPDFLNDQLFRSLARLQLDHLDVLLLHNPEYFLSDALHQRRHDPGTARNEYYRRLAQAFSFLEEQVAAGRVSYYGVSSNTFPHADSHPEFTSLERLSEIAEALSPRHHFRVIQFPANLFETGAMFEKNQSGGRTLLEFAAEKNLATLVNRPLNAMHGSSMMRLAGFATISTAEAEKVFPAQIAALAEAEKSFAQTVFRELHFERFVRTDQPVFAWAEQLQDGLTLFRDWAHWDHVKQHVIESQTEMALHFLREKAGGGAAVWQEWESQYRHALAAVIDTLSRYHARGAAASSETLARQLDEKVPALKTSLRLSQKALRVLLNIPGLDCVLLGMRRPQYVEDGIVALQNDPIKDVFPAFFGKIIVAR